MVLARWAVRATFVLSALGLLYGMAWAFLGLGFYAISGTFLAGVIYLAGFGLAFSPMVAYTLAQRIRHAESPVRRTAVSALAVLSPATALWGMQVQGYVARGGDDPWEGVAFIAVPGAVLTAALVLFAVLAARGR